jgi:hypothetical protein
VHGEYVKELKSGTFGTYERPVRCLIAKSPLVADIESAIAEMNSDQQLAIGVEPGPKGLRRQLADERADIVWM